MKRTPFKLKSSGPYKMMGSSSPLEQNIFNKNKPKKDLADTKIGQGIKKFFSDLKGASKVGVPREFFKRVGNKLKEGRAAAISKEKDRKEVDSKRTGVERMNRKGKSQYQLDQMDAAQARKDAKNNKNHPHIDKIGQ